MMRIVLPAVLAACVLAPAAAQDPPTERQQRLIRRVDAALKEEYAKMRSAAAEVVRRELGAPAAAPAGNLDKALELVTEELLRGHATYLASDELEGRNAGWPGNDKASEYIAAELKKYGLAPGGELKDGVRGWFQDFKVGGKATRNVIGLVEGSDPELKNEYLVIGAHFDHVGTADQGHWGRLGRAKGDDSIWNGADDNASGTSTVLAVARALGEGGIRFKRSVLVQFYSGEEGGLLGSAAYVRHPSFPLDKHVFMLNLDMVGRNPEKPVSIEGVGSAEGGWVRKAVEDAVAKTGLKAAVNDAVKLVGGDSDHSTFKNKGVPFAFFFSGFHADYHTVMDHAEKLAYPNMVKIGRTAVLILAALGDSAESPKFKKLEFGELPAPRARRTLGITSDDLDDDAYAALGLPKEEGGVLVDEVGAGSVAAKAGILAGDVIVSISGKALGRDSALEDLRAGIAAAKPGIEVDLVVIRGGKRVPLKALWEK